MNTYEIRYRETRNGPIYTTTVRAASEQGAIKQARKDYGIPANMIVSVALRLDI